MTALFPLGKTDDFSGKNVRAERKLVAALAAWSSSTTRTNTHRYFQEWRDRGWITSDWTVTPAGEEAILAEKLAAVGGDVPDGSQLTEIKLPDGTVVTPTDWTDRPMYSTLDLKLDSYPALSAFSYGASEQAARRAQRTADAKHAAAREKSRAARRARKKNRRR